MLDLYPELRVKLTEEIKEKIALVGNAQSVKINIHYGQPILELNQVELRNNQYVKGKVNKVKIGLSVWQSLLNRQPRIDLVKLESGQLSILRPIESALSRTSGGTSTFIEPEQVKIKLDDIKVTYVPKKLSVTIDKVVYKASGTKRIDSHVRINGQTINVKTEFTPCISVQDI